MHIKMIAMKSVLKSVLETIITIHQGECTRIVFGPDSVATMGSDIIKNHKSRQKHPDQ